MQATCPGDLVVMRKYLIFFTQYMSVLLEFSICLYALSLGLDLCYIMPALLQVQVWLGLVLLPAQAWLGTAPGPGLARYFSRVRPFSAPQPSSGHHPGVQFTSSSCR